MSQHAIRQLLNDVDLDDPHAFATAYVAYVETTGERPVLSLAALNWSRFGRI